MKTLFLTGLTLLVCSCLGEFEISPDRCEEDCLIVSGTVSNAVTNEPIPDARVLLSHRVVRSYGIYFNDGGEGDELAVDYTDERGRYRLSTEAGPYVASQNYVTALVDIAGYSEIRFDIRSIDSTDTDVPLSVNFNLTPIEVTNPLDTADYDATLKIEFYVDGSYNYDTLTYGIQRPDGTWTDWDIGGTGTRYVQHPVYGGRQTAYRYRAVFANNFLPPIEVLDHIFIPNGSEGKRVYYIPE